MMSPMQTESAGGHGTPHAEMTNFSSSQGKEVVYKQLLSQHEGLLVDSRNWVCNLANAASMLWHAYKSMPHPSTAVNWAGFYVIDPAVPKGNRLILGPFQGKTACQIIPFGRGVCGTAAVTQMVQIVPDVNAFKGHIACDGETLSEIVIPIVASGVDGSKRLVGLIDVDSTALSTFDEVDEKYLVEFAQQLADGCDWPL